jgi:ASC-1-like (ASCH) protein
MKLNTWAFEQISNGFKTYEIRLYDEKRRKIEIGDKIIFSKLPLLEDKIEVKVVSLIKADTFK